MLIETLIFVQEIALGGHIKETEEREPFDLSCNRGVLGDFLLDLVVTLCPLFYYFL